MKKIIKILVFLLSLISLAPFSLASETETNVLGLDQNNPIVQAFAERRQTLLRLVGGGTLEKEIASLKQELSKLVITKELNEQTKDKINEELTKLEEHHEYITTELVKNIDNTEEFDELVKKYNDEITLKKDLIEQLNDAIKENDINYAKIELLIEKYIQDKEQLDEDSKVQTWKKILIFVIITITTIASYFIFSYLSKNKKISTKKFVYLNFFIAFAYIVFLIGYFFYMYPEFSVFLIFMSGYMLVINSHLIGSFIGSILVLQRFKVGEVIRTNNTYGRISNITPLYIIINPLTESGVYEGKNVYIPHINILKEKIGVDKLPEQLIHNFKLVIKEDSGIDVMKFLSEVESNILQKFLHLKLRAISGTNQFYRISFEYTTTAHTIIVFNWKADTELSNKVERKIVGLLGKYKEQAKKDKEIKKENEKLEENNIDTKEQINEVK